MKYLTLTFLSLILISINSCGINKNNIYGKWRCFGLGNTIYEFSEDGIYLRDGRQIGAFSIEGNEITFPGSDKKEKIIELTNEKMILKGENIFGKCRLLFFYKNENPYSSEEIESYEKDYCGGKD